MPHDRDGLSLSSPPLCGRTPARWVESALVDPLALLCDHAHLERKAASNALELLGRWPTPVHAGVSQPAADRWCRRLTAIARDEIRHLAQVLRLLNARGGSMERHHRNPYAASLRGHVRSGRGLGDLLDRLLVSALIEARSAERFGLLAEHAPDADLRRFYARLLRSEQGHYRVFLELAASLPAEGGPKDERWKELQAAEAAILAALPPGPAMHSGTPPRGPAAR